MVDCVLKRKLTYLGFPAASEFTSTCRLINYLSASADDNIARLIVWLEDRVIRALPIVERSRDISSESWPDYVQSVWLIEPLLNHLVLSND